MQRFSRPIIKILYWTLILLAVMVGILRLSIPYAQYFKSDIESLLRESVLPGLSFSDIELEWNQFDHLIYVQNATLTIPGQADSIVVKQLSFEISLWRSLLAQSLVIHEVEAVVESLIIRRDQNKHWSLSDIFLADLLPAAATGQPSEDDSFEFKAAKVIDLTPKTIHIEIHQITIDDVAGGKQHKIGHSVFEMQRRLGVVQATLNTNLRDLGGQLSAQAIVSRRKVLVYANLDELNISPQLSGLFDIAESGLQQARLSRGKFWLNLDVEKSPVAIAQFAIDNGQYQLGDAPQMLPFSFDTRFNIQKMAEDWQIIGKIDRPTLNRQTFPSIETQLHLSQIDNTSQLSGWVNSLDLSMLNTLEREQLPDRITDTLVGSHLSGTVDNTWFNLDLANARSVSLATHINRFASHPVAGIPGVNNASALLTIGRENLLLQSTGKQLMLDFADDFRAPLNIDNYTLKANASLDDAGMHIAIPRFEVSNNDISLAGRLRLDFDQADAPFMYLRANFGDGNGATKSKYLPVKLLPPAALSWLDNSIKEADVSDGNLLYHGRLQDIRNLERDRSGEFHIDFQINKALLEFQPDWDSVRAAKARITFHNLGFLADITSASFGQIDAVQGQVSIADLTNPTLNLNLSANTDTSRALPTWLAMPVSQQFRPVGSRFKNARGQVQVDTRLAIPLKAADNTQVNVDLVFKNAAVSAPLWDMELQNLNGQLNITRDEITAKAIEARYFDDPVTIDITTDQVNDQTVIQADGLIHTRQLMGLLPEYMSAGVTGKSDWQVQLAIDNKQTDARQPVLSISGQSDLKNTRIEMPAPLLKSPGESQQAFVEIALYANDLIEFDVTYGPNLHVRGDLEAVEASAGFQLKSMDVGLSKALELNNLDRGVRLYGRLPSLSVDDWRQWHQTAFPQIDTADAANPTESAWHLIKSVDLQLESARIDRRQWTAIDFSLTQGEEEFYASIESSHLVGQFTLPKQQSADNPIKADLEYVKFESLESAGPTSKQLPGDFYNLSLVSQAASYDSYDVENLKLETRLNDNQFIIEQFDFQRDSVFLTGQGLWQHNPANNISKTSFDFGVAGSAFGQTMAALGLGDAIDGGTIELTSNLTWSNSLPNFDWETLTGNTQFILENGVFKDVEPGSARLIGLLSLNALPRRLLFGFSDVVGKGLEFDQVSGSYRIVGENLITDNTFMDGPSAKVLVTGTTGLRRQVYDQKMVVTPKVRQTLPVIGGIAAGSGVGWGLLLLQRIFKTVIDKSVEIEYTIKGSWADPEIELISKPSLEEEPIQRDK